MNVQFMPLEDFDDEDLRSSYIKGMSYIIRPAAPDPTVKGDKGTPAEKTPLAKKVALWITEGKVRLIGEGSPQLAQSRLRGHGEVQTIGAGDVGKMNL